MNVTACNHGRSSSGVSTIELAVVFLMVASIIAGSIFYLKNTVPTLIDQSMATLRTEAALLNRPRLGSSITTSHTKGEITISSAQPWFSFFHGEHNEQWEVRSGAFDPQFKRELRGLYYQLMLAPIANGSGATLNEPWCVVLFDPSQARSSEQCQVTTNDILYLESAKIGLASLLPQWCSNLTGPCCAVSDKELECINRQARWMFASHWCEDDSISREWPLFVAAFPRQSTSNVCTIREIAVPWSYSSILG